ncbi:MAG: efflux RND transporter periplasmic adaptor subunit [Armatimonadetes bacterium]|nr:efflux RND transporter periplasmic adaptor subunit [Armatimonadota bacterium]
MIRRKAILSIVIAGVIGAGLLWWGRSGAFRSLPEVDGVRARRGTLEVALPVTGTFETVSSILSFEPPGRLGRVTVREGQAVRRGDLLASLDAVDLQALVDQAEAAGRAATSDASRARAAVETARQQAAQAEAAYHAAQAQLAQLRAGPRASEFRQADAAVESASSARDQARRSLEVQERLYREGAISQTQLDAARAQYQSADAAYRQVLAQRDALRAGSRPEAITIAQEQVRQAEASWRAALANVRQSQALVASAQAHAEQAAAAARTARARAAQGHLRAPFEGFVGRIYLHAGAAVGPGVPVLSIVSASGWVTADVDESDIGRARIGQVARITADAYPGVVLTGRVTEIARQVDIKVGTRTVRVRVDVAGRAEMRAGTSVDVDLILQTVPDALLAPLEAVIAAENGDAHVYVIDAGILRRRAVVVGAANDVDMSIVRGVREGEVLAIADPAVLRDGQRVRVRSIR